MATLIVSLYQYQAFPQPPVSPATDADNTVWTEHARSLYQDFVQLNAALIDTAQPLSFAVLLMELLDRSFAHLLETPGDGEQDRESKRAALDAAEPTLIRRKAYATRAKTHAQQLGVSMFTPDECPILKMWLSVDKPDATAWIQRQFLEEENVAIPILRTFYHLTIRDAYGLFCWNIDAREFRPILEKEFAMPDIKQSMTSDDFMRVACFIEEDDKPRPSA